MSFLAPFYLLAGLAVALPIAFHMIRRTPQGRQVFSSVMFLAPSPPRMTKRSRIEEWLLLTLRALAICLLACAFARPFLRTQETSEMPATDGDQISLMIDRSASMQRPGYWDRAIERAEQILRTIRPQDQIQVQLFDAVSYPVFTFAEGEHIPPEARQNLILERLRQAAPGWLRTATGSLLLEAADQFRNSPEGNRQNRRLVLISDMQVGSGWELIQTTSWPEDVQLQVEDVSSGGESNASLQQVQQTQQEDAPLQVRITNNASSSNEAFTLSWKDEFTSPQDGQKPAAGASAIYVPRGQSKVVAAPPFPPELLTHELILSGDDVVFDNTCFIVPRSTRQLQIVYHGDAEEETGPEGLRFFLNPVFPNNSARTVSIVDWQGERTPPTQGDPSTMWIILAGSTTPEQLTWIRSWLEQGGHVLFVARNSDQALDLYELLGLASHPVKEAEVKPDAMLGRIDLNHPVLQTFNSPRFSDFTKVRFSHYRKFAPASLPGMNVLAPMEDGSPAFAEISAGKGKVILLTSGWNRADSNLALSSKFVPLMNALLEYSSPVSGPQRQLTTGEKLALTDLGFTEETIAVRMRGETFLLPREDTLTFDRPGIYRFARTAEDLNTPSAISIAVNLSPEESRTDPYAVELLAAAGVTLRRDTLPAQSASAAQQQRQLLNQELESRQQWWRWLVIAALGLLLLESALATWRGPRPAAKPTPA